MLKYVYIYKQNGICFMYYNRVKRDSTWKYISREGNHFIDLVFGGKKNWKLKICEIWKFD